MSLSQIHKCSFAQQIREYKIITPFPFYLRSGSLSLSFQHKVRLPLEPTNLFSFLQKMLLAIIFDDMVYFFFFGLIFFPWQTLLFFFVKIIESLS